MCKVSIRFALMLVVAIAINACGATGIDGTGITVTSMGNVEGIVSDSTTGSAVSGVVVAVGDLSTVSGGNGVYSLSDLATGSRTITASKSGYKAFSSPVNVTQGTTVTFNIEMKSENSTTTTDTIVNEDNAPTISNLSYSPYIVDKDQGGGVVTVSGSFDFIDNDGDLKSILLDGEVLVDQIVDVDGATSGTIGFAVFVDSTVVGNWSFELRVNDSMGNESNALSGAFEVVDAVTGPSKYDLIGNFEFTYTIIDTYSDKYVINTKSSELNSENEPYYLGYHNTYTFNDSVYVSYFPSTDDFMLVDYYGDIMDMVFIFTIASNQSLSGCWYSVNPLDSTDWSSCYALKYSMSYPAGNWSKPEMAIDESQLGDSKIEQLFELQSIDQKPLKMDQKIIGRYLELKSKATD